MKLSEMKNLSQTISQLFYFFKKYNITSCVYPVDDYDELKRNLLNSKFIGYKYHTGINTFNIDIDYNPEQKDREIFMFLFGRKIEGRGSSVLFDLDKRFSFIQFEIDSRKYPPFVKDLLNEKNELNVSYVEDEDKLEVISENKIMTFDSLKGFLRRNNIRRDLKWIEVE